MNSDPSTRALELAARLAVDTVNQDSGMNTWDAAQMIDAALAEAERAQMERDCAAVCYKCAEPMKGLLPAALWDGVWRHPVSGDDASLSCHANHIRRAFAALHPEPEGKAK